MDVRSWSPTAAANNAPPPDGWPENMVPSGVNDAAREMMAALKRWYDRANATLTSGGTASAQTLTYPVAPVSYNVGDCYTFFAGFTVSGATSLNVNGLGAKPMRRGPNSLTAGAIVAGQVVLAFYDGAEFQVVAMAPP